MGISPPRLGEGVEIPRLAADLNRLPQFHLCHRFRGNEALGAHMIILAGTIRIANGKRAAALVPIQNMVESTRTEPGCLAYALSFDSLDDHVVRIFEVFTD